MCGHFFRQQQNAMGFSPLQVLGWCGVSHCSFWGAGRPGAVQGSGYCRIVLEPGSGLYWGRVLGSEGLPGYKKVRGVG